jgi:GGDEF domain-containing protein/predicted transcriptional regulator
MATSPLKILLAASDRAILRHASRLLTVFGYQVRTVSSLTQAQDLLVADRPDIFMVDGTTDREAALALCRSVLGGAKEGFVYKILLVKDLKPGEVPPCLEAGVDDFIGMPLEHGELLARLRTAVRVIEFERRIVRQSSSSRAGLVGREPFVARLEVEMRHALSTHKPIACAVVEIDHHRALQAPHARAAVQAFLGRVVQALNASNQQLRVCSWFEDDRIAVVLSGSASDAVKFFDRARKQLIAPKREPDNASPNFTVSCGIADAAQGARSASELLRQAETSLLHAQASGGDFAAWSGQFADEDRSWEQLAKTGALFENSLARDIMVPCTLWLDENDTVARAAALFEQTQLQALPVVNEEGKFAGLLTTTGIQLRMAAENIGDRPVSSLTASDVASFDERTTLTALIDYFSQESPLAIVIVNKGRPTGLVTPSSLATLSEQLTTATFASTQPKAGRAGLIVSNLCGVDG